MDKICPICGGNNHCKEGAKDKLCWCMDKKIPSIVFDLIEEDDSCVCENCLDHYRDLGEKLEDLDYLYSRRSLRDFTGEKIDTRDLKLIVKAGFQAPSAHNKEARDYILVRDQEILSEMASVHKYGKMLASSGQAIVVCGNRDRQEREGYLIQDAAASTENILLASEILGYGACWCGLYPIEKLMEDFSKILDLPREIIPISVVALGLREKEKPRKNRFDKRNLHLDKW